MSSFYDELINGALRQTEKIASTEQEARDILRGLDDDQIEALAQEIGLLTKEAEELTVEEKATESARTTESDAEKDLKDSSEKSIEDGVKEEDKQIAESKAEADKTKEREDEHTDKKKEEVDSPTNADSGKDDSEYELTASEVLLNILKEGAALEEEIEKSAYAMTEAILSDMNVGVEDYLISRLGNEKIASVIMDKAVKLAYVSDKPVLQVADDLLTTMANIIEE